MGDSKEEKAGAEGIATYTLPVWPWDAILGALSIPASEDDEKDANDLDLTINLPRNASPTRGRGKKQQRGGKGKVAKKQQQEAPPPAARRKKLTIQNVVGEAFAKLFKQFDALSLKREPKGRISFSGIKSFIDESKIPNLKYARFVKLKPDKEGLVYYKDWKVLAQKAAKEDSPPAHMLEGIREKLTAALDKIAQKVVQTAEEKKAALEERHKKGMQPSYYERMAKMGDAKAQYLLGSCYQFGKGVEPDLDKAILWYKSAAESGNARAMCSLAYCYELGQTEDAAGGAAGEKKKVKSEKKKKKKKEEEEESSAEGGEKSAGKDAKKKAAKGDAKGGQAQPESNADLELAFVWYEKSANKGYPAGMRNVGMCYEYGRGVEEDLEKAEEWYKKAADAGDDWAKHTRRIWKRRHKSEQELKAAEQAMMEKRLVEESKAGDSGLAATAARVKRGIKKADSIAAASKK